MALIQQTRVEIPVTSMQLGAMTSLTVPLITQEQSQWCWAACIQMVLQFDDPANMKRQCELANSAFNLTSACESPSSTICNKPLPIYQVAAEWARLQYNSSFSATHLAWTDVQNEIVNNQRPIECGLLWTKGGGHAVLIVGCFEDGGNQWVDVYDPIEGFKRVFFREFLNAYGLGVWAKAWTDIRVEH